MVDLENGQLHFGSKSYAVRNITSVEAYIIEHRHWFAITRLAVCIIGGIVLLVGLAGWLSAHGDEQRFSTNVTGPRFVEAAANADGAFHTIILGLVISCVGAGMYLRTVTPNATSHLMITMTSGEQHRIDFAIARDCISMKESIVAAMGQRPIPYIDARQVHIHADPKQFR